MSKLPALCLFLLFWSAAASLSWAQEAAEDEPEVASEGVEESAEKEDGKRRLRPRFSIHGFLSLAYAQSDGLQIFGIPEEGTGDYRNAALQLRLDITPRDAVAVQLNHEALGESPDQELRDDVELDWALYQRRIGARTSLRVGRVPLPYGIYNEIRDVGTLLPFYRPPVNVYRQGGSGMIVVETIDGLVVGHTFRPADSWDLEADAFYGGFDFTEDLRQIGGPFVETQVENAVGTSLWVHTPVQGVRFGVGAMRSDLTGGGHASDDEFFYFTGSFEALLGKWSIRSEYLESTADLLIARIDRYRAYYVELGYSLTSKLRIYLQGETARLAVSLPPLISGLTLDFNDDLGLALTYSFRSNLLLRAEAHTNQGFLGDEVLLNPFVAPPEVDYFIVSFSGSF